MDCSSFLLYHWNLLLVLLVQIFFSHLKSIAILGRGTVMDYMHMRSPFILPPNDTDPHDQANSDNNHGDRALSETLDSNVSLLHC